MRRSNHRKPKIKTSKFSVFRLLFLIISVSFLCALSFVAFKVFTLDDFIYVNKLSDGSAEIVTQEFKYKIPADTELESTRGYGKYKLSSLWILSEKDNMGKLIPETITKNFSLPISFWKNGGKSNLNLYQKLKILFSNKNKSIDSEITSSKLSNSILIQFINPELTDISPKIDLEDLTGSFDVLEKVSKIIESIGGKITTNSKGYNADLDCEILGSDTKLIKIFSEIFDCKENVDKSLTTDLKIRLGAKFAERF